MYNFETIKKYINEETILEYVTDYDIFKYYLDEFKIGKAFSSPFRTDSKASFNIGFNHNTGKLYYNDYVLGGGNFIQFVMYNFNLNYKEACNKIVIDLNLNKYFNLYNINKILNKESKIFIKSNIEDIKKFKEETRLYAKIKEWEQYDLDYWEQYGISKSTLEKFNIKPASHMMVGENIFKLDKYAYVFIENKDDEKTLTIYQPFNDKYKWTKNHDFSTWYCWNQLPEKAEQLIITKSRKDIMSIFEITGIPSTGLQNEKIIPKPQVFEELTERFGLIYLLYDNDFDKTVNWGQEFSKKFAENYPIIILKIPDKYQSKDFSDLVKNVGPYIAKQVLLEMIENALPF